MRLVAGKKKKKMQDANLKSVLKTKKLKRKKKKLIFLYFKLTQQSMLQPSETVTDWVLCCCELPLRALKIYSNVGLQN